MTDERASRAAAALGALARPVAGPAQDASSATASSSAVVGLAVLGVGILAIPYPGPGWAIVFVGLGILATEFDWARRLLAYAKERYDKVMDWFHRQGRIVQVLGGVLTALVVAVTLWLLGALDWSGGARRHRASAG